MFSFEARALEGRAELARISCLNSWSKTPKGNGEVRRKQLPCSLVAVG